MDQLLLLLEVSGGLVYIYVFCASYYIWRCACVHPVRLITCMFGMSIIITLPQPSTNLLPTTQVNAESMKQMQEAKQRRYQYSDDDEEEDEESNDDEKENNNINSAYGRNNSSNNDDSNLDFSFDRDAEREEEAAAAASSNKRSDSDEDQEEDGENEENDEEEEDDEDSSGERDFREATIKLVRLLANLTIDENIGAKLGARRDVLEVSLCDVV